ncbi:MAG: hypothetical protein GY722_17350 [bacterium]|nr:hypothetical protein [bacterium]
MTRLLVGIIGLAAALFTISVMSASRVDADTSVTVLSADEVILRLPVSPSTDLIAAELHDELGIVAEASNDPRIASALNRIDNDKDLVRQVAATPSEMFDSGEAAATATALYDIQLESAEVIVTVITVEIVPGYGSTAGSREHEDGHALINKKIARRCAVDALHSGVADGLQGEALINRMVAEISASGNPVHDKYHSYVRNARYGQHIRYAEQALQDVAGC